MSLHVYTQNYICLLLTGGSVTYLSISMPFMVSWVPHVLNLSAFDYGSEFIMCFVYALCVPPLYVRYSLHISSLYI